MAKWNAKLEDLEKKQNANANKLTEIEAQIKALEEARKELFEEMDQIEEAFESEYARINDI